MELEIFALIISGIAILFTLLKDFILPAVLQPKLIFSYKNDQPYKRDNVHVHVNDQSIHATFFRFTVLNIGKRPAERCRCQLLSIKNHEKNTDYSIHGFPLRWAGRPETILDQAHAERLNIGIGEKEFIDLLCVDYDNNNFYLQKYHSVSIGLTEMFEAGNYVFNIIFSGDNFKPYKIIFSIEAKLKNSTAEMIGSIHSVKRLTGRDVLHVDIT